MGLATFRGLEEKTMTLKNALVALAASLALSACGGTVDFSLEKDLAVDSTVDAGTYLDTFDLAAEAGSAWKHRDKIDSVSLVSAEAVVVTVDPQNAATALSGQAWLLPDGATDPSAAGSASLGTWSDEAVVAGNTIVLTPSPALDALLKTAFRGSGRLGIYAEVTNSSGQRVACTLHLTLGAKLKWKVF